MRNELFIRTPKVGEAISNMYRYYYNSFDKFTHGEGQEIQVTVRLENCSEKMDSNNPSCSWPQASGHALAITYSLKQEEDEKACSTRVWVRNFASCLT